MQAWHVAGSHSAGPHSGLAPILATDPESTRVQGTTGNPRTALEVFGAFLKLGLTSFGGPIAHIGYFRRELVERRRWVTEGQFSQLVAICQFLPGPASSQVGFAMGLLRAGWAGGVAAFVAFTLPAALLLIGFAALLPALPLSLSEAGVQGLKLVALAVVADAVRGMAGKLCPDAPRRTIAVLAAVALLVGSSVWLQVGVVLAGALGGWAGLRAAPAGDGPRIAVGFGRSRGMALLLVFGGLLLALSAAAPATPGLLSMADAFYRAGALVFGGGHVVLPLLEEAVVAPGWVTQEQFLAGYGAAQAIPGPMFALSAYLGAIIPSGHGAWLSAAVALLFMFLPGFLLVAAVLPLWGSLAQHPRAAGAIAGVNAAVVGLLGAALYDPIFTASVHSGTDLSIAVVAFAMLAVWRLSPLWAVAWCLAASLAAALP